MQDTSIEWTDKTSNCFKARHKPFDDRCPRCGMTKDKIRPFNFCVKISPGCAECYACALTHRWGGPDYVARMKECLEPVLVEKELHAILKAKVAPGTKVFPFDMTDLFFEFWPDEFLDKFFAVAALRPDMTFQILTKRAGRMYQYFTEAPEPPVLGGMKCSQWRPWHIWSRSVDLPTDRSLNWGWSSVRPDADIVGAWPLPNVWLGISAEDQKTANERIPWLLKTPAAVRFVSYEPALDSVDFKKFMPQPLFYCPGCAEEKRRDYCIKCGTYSNTATNKLRGIDLLICGGESGPHARPFNIQWAADVIRQCAEADIACFTKQLGSCPVMNEDEWRARPGTLILNPRNRHKAPEGTVPILLHDSKGGDPNEWLPNLRVRELPEVER